MSIVEQHEISDVDIAIVGAGGAGITMLEALARHSHTHPGTELTVAVFDDVQRLGRPTDDRTWCYWTRDAYAAPAAVCATFDHLLLATPQHTRVVPLRRHSYVMLRSADYYREVASLVATTPNLDVTFHAAADRVAQNEAGMRVVCDDGEWNARYVLDSRPRPAAPRTTRLEQRFAGAYVASPDDMFDPATPAFMDFRAEQPAHGVGFGYVLPMNTREALIEYTVFSADPLTEDDLHAARVRYTEAIYGDAARSLTDKHTEFGVIEMSDAARSTGSGRHILLGSAGGAVRPSTGYAFAAMRRTAEELALAAWRGEPLKPSRPYRSHHELLDAILLRGLDTGVVDGVAFFDHLFTHTAADTILEFLDGSSTPAGDLAVLWGSPKMPMITSAISLARARWAAREGTR